MRIVFRNLERSELAKEAVYERLGSMVEKFPRLRGHRITVTLFMENSPVQPGPDCFGVKVLIQGPAFRTITLSKTSPSLYMALADVRDHLTELLNRFGDRTRVIARARERRYREAV